MPRKSPEIEMTQGKFIHGWAEFLTPTKEPVFDSDGEFDYYRDRPGKIVVRYLVELDDGECAIVQGKDKKSMRAVVKGSLKAAFPTIMKEHLKIGQKKYKKNEKMKIKKTTYPDNGRVVFREEA